MNIRRIFLGLPVLAAVSLQAQTPTLTTEWITGAGSHVKDVPEFVWLNVGTAMMDDVHLPSSQNTFEILDPVTAKQKPALVMTRAVASLKSVTTAELGDALPWPITF